MLPLRRTLATLLLGLALPASTTAQAMMPDVASLRGITHVWLAISPLRSDLAATADTSALRTKIELKLREHGIQVFGPGDIGTQADAVVNVDVNSIHGVLWAIDAEVSVQQTATVQRTQFVDVTAITWRGGEMSTVGDEHVADAVLSDASDAIDQFLDAWLQANPRSR